MQMIQKVWMRWMAAVVLAALAASSSYASDGPVTGDSFVTNKHASANFGSRSNLDVGNGSTALLQFDLTSLPSGTTAGQISKATLTLFVNRINTSGAVDVQAVTASWTESTVTFNTVPAFSPTPVASFTAAAAGQFVTVDVTSLVQSWISTPSSNFGIALTSTAGDLLFDSKENDETSHAASLDITVVSQGPQGPIGPPGVSGPQGVAGPAGATGLPGPQGPIGPIGATGASGPAGPQGPVGAIGPIGPVGATGAPGPIGATGAPGPVGPQGVTGATGPQGATGATGPSGPPVNFKGAWSSSTAYAIGDAVSENGSSYIALTANSAIDPATDVAGSGGNWALLAKIGDTGATGATGPQGVAGPMGLTGPQGPIGLTGAPGPIGATGATGSAGPVGATGPQGPAGAPGSTGAAGPQGPPVSFKNAWNAITVYAIGDAVSENGSSYIALSSNLAVDPATDVAGSGTTWALLAQKGATGSAATVAVGTTTTGAFNTSAVVTNSGTSSAAVLNFTIPQGVPGPAGPSGPTGATGPAGPQGPAGANGSGVNAFTFNATFINPGTSAGTTFFVSPMVNLTSFSSNTTIASGSQFNFAVAPATCTLSGLNVGVNNYNAPAADTTTITVYRNLVATTMTCSVTTNGNGSGCSDTTHTLAVTRGDSLALSFKETNASPFNGVMVELVCQ